MLRKVMATTKALGENSSRGRMMRGVLANFYDKGAITLVQLLIIPVAVQAWGTAGYGIWLMLMTIPTYIALSDLGLGTAAGVVLTQCVSRGDYDQAVRVLQSTIAFVMGMIMLVSVAAVGFAAWYYYHGAGAAAFSAADIAFAILFITGYSLVMSQMSIVTVVYRATHKFAFATTFSGTWMLLEGFSFVIFSFAGLGLAEVALGYLIIRTVGYFAFVALLRSKEPWVRVGFQLAETKLIREMASPSAAALGLTFATAIILQGTTLVLGATANASVVALFGASRTLSRTPLQLSGLFLRPSIIELTRAISQNDIVLERRLSQMNVLIALAATVPFGIAVVVFGQPLLSLLSGAGLTASPNLFALLAAAAALNATWTALSAPLIAMNRQREFSYLYLSLAIFSLLLLFLLPWQTAMSAATLMLLVEASVFVYVAYKSFTRWRKK